MNSLIWNIRGSGSKSSQQQVWYMCNKYKLNVLVLSEPLVQLDSFLYCNKFQMDKVVANRSNKIWVFSDVNYEVEVIKDEVQFLYCKITSNLLPTPVLMTYVYAKCTRQEKKKSMGRLE